MQSSVLAFVVTLSTAAFAIEQARAQCAFNGPGKAKGTKGSLIRALAGCPAVTPVPFPFPNSQTAGGTPSCAPPYAYSQYEFAAGKSECTFASKTKKVSPCWNGSPQPCLHSKVTAKCNGILDPDGDPNEDSGFTLQLTARITADDPGNGDMTVIDVPLQMPLAVTAGRLSLKVEPQLIPDSAFGPLAMPGCVQIDYQRIAIYDPDGNIFAVLGSGTR